MPAQTDPRIAASGIEMVARSAPHTFAQWVAAGPGYSDEPFYVWPYMRYLGERIARATRRGNARIMAMLPPGHGKSRLLARWTPVWLLDNFKHHKVIAATHAANLAVDHGRWVRERFRECARLRTTLKEDSQAVGQWNTSDGGSMLCTGIGGKLLGFRANTFLLDDPYGTWEDAQSLTYRRSIVDWVEAVLTSRLEPEANVILLMHRMHTEDICGHLLKTHGTRWDAVRLPALAEPGDPVGRAPGEALCPERFSAEALAERMIEAGPVKKAAMWQQRPEDYATGRAYDRFLQTHIQDVELRDDLPLQVAWDFNYTPGVICLVGQYDPRQDLFTCCHEVWGPYWRTPQNVEALIKLIRELCGQGEFKWPHLEIFGDASGHNPNSRTTQDDYDQIRLALKEASIPSRMRVPRANPPIISRVETLNEAFKDGRGVEHYAVNPRCGRLIRDYLEVKLDDERKIDKSDTELTHPSDAEGYRVIRQRPIRKFELARGSVVFAG